MNFPAALSWSLTWTCLFLLPGCNGRETTQHSEIQLDYSKTLLTAKTTQISEYIVEIFQDKSGDLWFGTVGDGAVRLREGKLKYFTTADGLIGNEVPAVTQDPEGNLWFGTHDGVSRYDGKTFTNFGPEKGVSGPGCTVLVDSKSRIWVGSNKGLALFNGQTFDPFELPIPTIDKMHYKWEIGKIWSIMEDSKGNLWFGRDGYGACKYDGKNFTLFTEADGLCSNNVASIAEDKQGNIWFGSITSDFPEFMAHGGASRYDGKQFQQFPEITGLTGGDVYSIFQAPFGDLWICAVGRGAYRYNGKEFTLFPKTDRPDLIYNFAIQAFLQDYNGQLWFGFSGGLFQFDGDQFVNRPKEYFSGEPEK